MINTFFENIEIEICKIIETSSSNIDIAVAWLTNYGIINLLKVKAKQDNIRIRIIVNDDKINNTQINQFKVLSDIGVQIFKYKDSNLMHNKFAVIDSSIVITGSYNWTKSAEDNIENVIITKNNELAIKYQKEFERLINKSDEINSTFYKNSINKYFEELNDESIWRMLDYFHTVKYNPSVFRVYKTICGTKSSIAKYTKDFPYYNTISKYKSKRKVLSDLKLFFENNKHIIEEKFKYEERGWDKIDFPGERIYNLLNEDEIEKLRYNKNLNLNAGKKWTSSELNVLSKYILKTNNTLYLSKLLNRSEQSIIKKARRILYEDKNLFIQWEKLKATIDK